MVNKEVQEKMQDHYSYVEQPDIVTRTKVVKEKIGQSTMLSDERINQMIEKVCKESYELSYTGWQVYGSKEEFEKSKKVIEEFEGKVDEMYKKAIAKKIFRRWYTIASRPCEPNVRGGALFYYYRQLFYQCLSRNHSS